MPNAVRLMTTSPATAACPPLGGDRPEFDLAFVPFCDEPPLTVRACYKCELARLYGCSPRTLSNWISRYADRFAKTGYRKTDKQLTPRQVRLLFELVGEPNF